MVTLKMQLQFILIPGTTELKGFKFCIKATRFKFKILCSSLKWQIKASEQREEYERSFTPIKNSATLSASADTCAHEDENQNMSADTSQDIFIL